MCVSEEFLSEVIDEFARDMRLFYQDNRITQEQAHGRYMEAKNKAMKAILEKNSPTPES